MISKSTRMATIGSMPPPTGSRRSTATSSISAVATTAAVATTTTTEPRVLRLGSLSAVVFALLALMAIACGGDDLTLPGAGEPARISIARGDNQTDTVGRSLPDSLVVK